MTENSPILPAAPLPAELVQVAREAGIHDLDALRLADLSKYKADHNRFYANAADFIEGFKAEKPHFFKEDQAKKHARDMTAGEAAAYIRELERKSQQKRDNAQMDRVLASFSEKPKRRY